MYLTKLLIASEKKKGGANSPLLWSIMRLANHQTWFHKSASLRDGRRIRRWLLRQGSYTRPNISPPSHSLLFVGRTRRITQYTASGMRRIKTNSALPDRCSRRFRCAKNNTQSFLTCYVEFFECFLLLVGEAFL